MAVADLFRMYELWRVLDGTSPELEALERAIVSGTTGTVASRLNETGSADADELVLVELHKIRERYRAGELDEPWFSPGRAS